MEEMIRLIGAAMVAVMLTVSLRALAPDISALIGAAAGVLLLGYAVYILSPALGELRELAGKAEIMLVCLPLITELLSLARSLFVGQTG